MEPSEQVKAIEPRFHPNPPPKSTVEFRRDCLTGKQILDFVQFGGPGFIIAVSKCPLLWNAKMAGHGVQCNRD